jgi:hypothetical protein
MYGMYNLSLSGAAASARGKPTLKKLQHVSFTPLIADFFNGIDTNPKFERTHTTRTLHSSFPRPIRARIPHADRAALPEGPLPGGLSIPAGASGP